MSYTLSTGIVTSVFALAVIVLVRSYIPHGLGSWWRLINHVVGNILISVSLSSYLTPTRTLEHILVSFCTPRNRFELGMISSALRLIQF